MREVVRMTDAHHEGAGALLAARHARERVRFPLLPATYEQPARATELVRRTAALCTSVVAIDDSGEVVGFLSSLEVRPDPASAVARYSPEHASLHPVHGHAVADHADARLVYGVLYRELAADAVERGIVDHVVHLPIGDAYEAPWAALSFGRTSFLAVRDLAPVGRALPAGVEVRAASKDELDIVDDLVDEEAVFHAASPIFRPYRRSETADAVRAELADALASDDHVFLVARHEGHDVGVISVGPGLGSPLYVPDGAVYIAATAVLRAARGAGVGAALVDAALSWAREHGHLAACLHFDTPNMTSTAFWTGIGFVPAMVHVRRRLDDRILTSRPEPR